MAGIRRDQARPIVLAATLLGAPLFVILLSPSAAAQSLYHEPVLTIDSGRHSAPIWSAAVDAAGHFAVTGSDDKTVRVWSVDDGKLVRTIRVPAGPGYIGKIFAVAISPNGDLLAAGGGTWTTSERSFPIYLFDRRSGRMTARIGDGLTEGALHLVFSADGRYLAAVLFGGQGLRVYDRENKWSEVFRDVYHGWASFGAAFAGDGRLATTSFDGNIRLYDSRFTLVRVKTISGHRPNGIAFSPDGKVLAVGYYDRPAVDLLDAKTLDPLPGRREMPAIASLAQVSWSLDGETLFAGGMQVENVPKEEFVYAWAEAGHGKPRRISVGHDRVAAIVALTEHRLLVATMDPQLAVFEADDQTRWSLGNPGADFRGQQATMSVSPDGMIVDFGFDRDRTLSMHFDVHTMSLRRGPAAAGATRPPRQKGLSIANWMNSDAPTLDGKRIVLVPNEVSRSLAIDPDHRGFVVGAAWSLRAFDAEGRQLWVKAVPAEVWAVNVTDDGRLAVAGYADGTIRWHRMDDGREILALMVLSDQQNWVIWTPEGYYNATPGAFGVLRWHVNRGAAAAADAVAISEIRRLKRPDAVALVLEELDIIRALGRAELEAASRDVQETTKSAVAPGGRLHVLAVGISNYGDKAANLRLNFAADDAAGVVASLFNTQVGPFNSMGGLFVQIWPQLLRDAEADRAGIFRALDSMKSNMAKDPMGQDLAVVFFSGHGAMIDDRFYLLPYGVDARTPADLKASAISANDLHDEVAALTKYGRVLVLLDACHSGGVSSLKSDADLLRRTMADSNVTVLTSSTAEELSFEDASWSNGAFTRVLLDALGKDGDEDHDGLISMSELTRYLSAHVPSLTHGQQRPGVEQRFEGPLFIAGQ
jgi:Caspase domain/WD domain, G-beta repeat